MQVYDLRSRAAVRFLKKNGIAAAVSQKEITTTSNHEDIEYPKGFVGDLAQFICNTGYKQQKWISIGASIALCSAVLGQRVKTESGMRCNVFINALAPTAAGKEHGRRMIDRILCAAGAESIIAGDEIASDVGIIDQLSHQPQLIYLLDEFGKFIKRTSVGSNPYLVGILEMLMKLYGVSDGTYRSGWKKTDHENSRKIIIQPHLVLYATATPEQFWPTLNTDLISNGFLNRFFIFENEEETPIEQNVAEPVIPPRIIEQIKELYSLPVVPFGSLSTEPMPLLVRANDKAKALLADAQLYWREKSNEDSKARDLWKRANDMTRKLSLILCAANFTKERKGQITEVEMSDAITITNRLCTNASNKALEYLGDTNHERFLMKLYHKIKERSTGISNRELSRCFQSISASYRSQILDQLVESGRIKPIKIQNSERISRGWIALED